MLKSVWDKHLNRMEQKIKFWAKATDEATTIAERLQIIKAQNELMKAIATMQKYKDLGLVEAPMRNVTPAIKELPNE